MFKEYYVPGIVSPTEYDWKGQFEHLAKEYSKNYSPFISLDTGKVLGLAQYTEELLEENIKVKEENNEVKKAMKDMCKICLPDRDLDLCLNCPIDEFVHKEKEETMKDKRKYCQGCRNNFYNDNNDLGVKECWSLKEAKLVWKKEVHMTQRPPWTQKAKRVLSCYHKPHYVYISPDRTH